MLVYEASYVASPRHFDPNTPLSKQAQLLLNYDLPHRSLDHRPLSPAGEDLGAYSSGVFQCP
jgi:hypothetical protein